MAFSVKKFNAKKFDLSPAKDAKYLKLAELYNADEDTIFTVGALYINTKGKFGDSPVAGIVRPDDNGEATIPFLVNLPRFQLDDVKEMLADPEAIEAINAMKVGFRIRTYFSERFGVDCYSAEWEDL